VNLTDSELDTVLAALRFYQGHYAEGMAYTETIMEIASEHGQPLDDNGIDELCHKLNFGDDDAD
jgi:hypothetical protein